MVIRNYVEIHTKDFITDFFSEIKNIVGGKLKAYSKWANKSIEETMKEFEKKYPKANITQVRLDEFTDGALMVHIQGEEHES